MTKSLLIERTFQGFGLAMTVGLFFILRSILRQVRAEARSEREGQRPENRD